MALNDSATLVVGSGNYYTAATGTAMPANLLAPGVAWTKVGHTSLEDILTIESEGGDANIVGTLQNKTLRTKYSARTETMQFIIQQFDEDSLKLFYGANAPVLPDGSVGVPTEPEPTVCAFLAVFTDGANSFGIYAPKSEIYRADDVELADTESLAGLPVGVTPIAHSTNNWTYAVTALGRVPATGAASGTPGTFTPADSQPPYGLGDLVGVTASPTTAWTTGQHIVLGDGSKAHWNGTAWVSGEAV